ncbi:MAG: imidazole glycerol phosphate synthase subunit HisH [Gammaproteobacteria bacterium]|nr:imidazole glycerol phosphate synthase subunit HisH [Gammaproteobacteria bacterium]
MQNIVVIDYGCGNLRSVKHALLTAGGQDRVRVDITDNPEQIQQADKLVLPGQGSFLDCMLQIQKLKLFSTILDGIQNKPTLAICVGLQILLATSAEAESINPISGFSLIPGRVVKFDQSTNSGESPLRPLKVPHIGWNQVFLKSQSHPVLKGIDDKSYFYFTHSYFASPVGSQNTLAVSYYGTEFASVLAYKNIFATQFHPEKSLQNGLNLLSNFVIWDGQA